MTLMRACWLLWLTACLAAPALAQAPAPAAASSAPETPALDMREEMVRIQVKVRDLYGREESRPMPITIYRPAGHGPYPILVLNHGRAVTEKRASQGRWHPEAAARYFVAKGFVVLAPTRVGYWETYGDFDPESSGACNAMRVEPASQAVSDQVLADLAFAKVLSYADTSRWLVAGQSVGGFASVATVGRNPPGLLGGINFSGGAGGNPEKSPGRPCSPWALEHHWGELAKQAHAPMLWLYWQNDKYWGETIPKQWHHAWVTGGGAAQMETLLPVGDDGHAGFNADMDHWLPLVDAFLAKLGFTQDAMAKRPAATSFAKLDEVDKVPLREAAKAGYQKFLALPSPRAFAVNARGGYGFSRGDYAVGRALGNCQRFGQPCKLYAVDDEVVWMP
jgi:dienelactone hydrolase